MITIHSIGPRGSQKYRFYFTPDEENSGEPKYISPELNEKQVLVFKQVLIIRQCLINIKSETMPINFEETLQGSETLLKWKDTEIIKPSELEWKEILSEAKLEGEYLQQLGRFWVDITEGNIPCFLRAIESVEV